MVLVSGLCWFFSCTSVFPQCFWFSSFVCTVHFGYRMTFLVPVTSKACARSTSLVLVFLTGSRLDKNRPKSMPFETKVIILTTCEPQSKPG